MKTEVNAAATGGILETETLEEKVLRLERENAEHRARAAAQLEDRHTAPGVANESRSSANERFAIIVEEGRDENDMNPIFVGVNGRGYSIRRGEVVEVPGEVLGVLNDAVEVRSTPYSKDGVPAGMTTRAARRFPYRNYGKVVDSAGNRTNLVLPEGAGA